MDMVGAGAAGAASASEDLRPLKKRLKTVFSKTAEVAAVWAAQDRPEARTGSNTRFRREWLYSYGTVIARIVPSVPDGRPIALIASQRWSSGTSKVQREAAAAARRLGMPVYEVPRLGDGVGDILGNVQHFVDLIDQSIDAITKAVRWDTARSHRAEALRLIALAHLYSNDMSADWRWSGRNPLTVRNPKEEF